MTDLVGSAEKVVHGVGAFRHGRWQGLSKGPVRSVAVAEGREAGGGF